MSEDAQRNMALQQIAQTLAQIQSELYQIRLAILAK